LAPFPVSLFDEKGMWKTNKSALYGSFKLLPPEQEQDLHFENGTYVIDGGFLLHRVV
jgi:hypothetical protein